MELMDSKIKACIITAAIGGGWYEKGKERLIKSLMHHGFAYDIIHFNYWPEVSNQYDKSCPYNIKAACFEYVISKGYTHITWMDCSVWAIKDVTPLLDIIQEKGYYVLNSGYKASETCNDRCLDYFNINRDQADLIPDSSTAVFGVNLETEIGRSFISAFIKSAKDGVFSGSRQHDNQSADPRFLFHRQDQSAVTCIASLLGMELSNFGELVCYYEPEMNESILLTMRGM